MYSIVKSSDNFVYEEFVEKCWPCLEETSDILMSSHLCFTAVQKGSPNSVKASLKFSALIKVKRRFPHQWFQKAFHSFFSSPLSPQKPRKQRLTQLFTAFAVNHKHSLSNTRWKQQNRPNAVVLKVFYSVLLAAQHSIVSHGRAAQRVAPLWGSPTERSMAQEPNTVVPGGHYCPGTEWHKT